MKSSLYMAWHILKKDVRLLWPFILASAGVQFTAAGLMYARDHYDLSSALINLSRVLQMAAILVTVFLTVTVVHQDAIPGLRQDWLVRPVRRRDLLLAKVLFVVLMVHGPMVLADTMQGLANGFPVGQSLAAAVSRAIYLLMGLTLPALAFASLTRNMSDAVIGGVLAFLGFAGLQILVNNTGQLGPLRGTGLFWIAESSMFAVALIGSSLVLAVQFFHRKTVRGRWIMGVVAFVFQLAYLVPWSFGSAVQQKFSPNPGSGDAVTFAFQPDLKKFRLPEGMTRTAITGRGAQVLRDEASTVYLPITVGGVPDGAVLNADHAELILISSDGRVIHRGPADNLLIHKEGKGEPMRFAIGVRRTGFFRMIGPEDKSVPQGPALKDGEALVYQGLPLPRNLYDRIKDRPLRAEIDYSLTLLRSDAYTMPALGGDLRIPGVGRCRSQMDTDADDIQVRCIQAGASSTCATGFLEHPASGMRNPSAFSCWPDYAPYFGQYMPDSMSRFGASLRFRDLTGLARYPVGMSQLPQARIMMRFYHAQDHFTRRVVIPEIRLSDWEATEHSLTADER